MTHGITEQKRDTATTLFVELDLERTSNLVLARIQQTCEQDRKALARLGRVAFTERLTTLS